MFIVFDLDGTIANVDHRAHILDEEHASEARKWDAFFDECDKDGVYIEMALLFDTLAVRHQHRIEIWTGRSERVGFKTNRWLELHLRKYNHDTTPLRMRKIGDLREDTEIKGEWIKDHGKPHIVFDDRTKMVNWWREQGIACCQVRNHEY